MKKNNFVQDTQDDLASHFKKNLVKQIGAACGPAAALNAMIKLGLEFNRPERELKNFIREINRNNSIKVNQRGMELSLLADEIESNYSNKVDVKMKYGFPEDVKSSLKSVLDGESALVVPTGKKGTRKGNHTVTLYDVSLQEDNSVSLCSVDPLNKEIREIPLGKMKGLEYIEIRRS